MPALYVNYGLPTPLPALQVALPSRPLRPDSLSAASGAPKFFPHDAGTLYASGQNGWQAAAPPPMHAPPLSQRQNQEQHGGHSAQGMGSRGEWNSSCSHGAPQKRRTVSTSGEAPANSSWVSRQQAVEPQGEWFVDRYLGGTTGQAGRDGRCAVCMVQRKGRCGTKSAPHTCLRVQVHLCQGHEIPEAPRKVVRSRERVAHARTSSS